MPIPSFIWKVSPSLSSSAPPVICLKWPSTQLASALDEVQEPAIRASFGLQMSNFFLILVAKTNDWALFIVGGWGGEVAVSAVTWSFVCRGEKRLSQIMTEQAALCGTANRVIPLSSYLTQEELCCSVSMFLSLCVCVWSYMQTCVLLGWVVFECVYIHVWLVWLVSLWAWGC